MVDSFVGPPTRSQAESQASSRRAAQAQLMSRISGNQGMSVDLNKAFGSNRRIGSGGRRIGGPEEGPTTEQTIIEEEKPTKEITKQSLSRADLLGGYRAVYQKNTLQGFQKNGRFVPREAALTKSGVYRPQDVKFQRAIQSKTYGGSAPTSTIRTYKTPQGYIQEVTTGSKRDYIVGKGRIGSRGARVTARYKGEVTPVIKEVKTTEQDKATKDYLKYLKSKMTKEERMLVEDMKTGKGFVPYKSVPKTKFGEKIYSVIEKVGLDPYPATEYGQVIETKGTKGFSVWNIPEQITKKIPQKYKEKITDTFGIEEKPAPKWALTTEKVLSGIPVSLFFSPAMASGTKAVTQQYYQDMDTGEFIEASELKEYTQKKLSKLLGKFDSAYATEGKEGVYQGLKEISESGKDIKGIETVLEALKQRGFIKEYAVDTLSNQFIVDKIQFAPKQTTIFLDLDVTDLAQVGQMENVGSLTLLKPAVTDKEVQIVGQTFIQTPKEEVMFKTKNIQKFIQPERQIIKSKISQKEKQMFGLSQPQAQKSKQIYSFKQPQKQVSKQRLKERQLFGLSQPQAQKYSQKYSQKYKQGLITGLVTSQTTSQTTGLTNNFYNQFYNPSPYPVPSPTPTPSPTPNPPPTFIPKYQKGKAISITRKIPPQERNLFIPEVRKKGKFVPVSKPIGLKSAVAIGKKTVTETLGASVRIRKAKTDKFIPVPLSRGFRPSKKDPFVLVQKKGRRLASPMEVREIKQARRRIRWL
jgi:hypothetical protein